MEASIELNARFGPVHFSLGELRRGQGDTTASNAHYLRYLQLGKLQTGMGAWSTYWTGDPEKALVLFEDLLRNSPQNEWLQRGLLSARSAIEEN